MAQKKKASDTSDEDKNKKEDESTEDETDEVETEDENDSEEKGSDEDDLDEELEKENKRGKPDQNKAKDAFKLRKAKKVEDSQDEDEAETEDEDDDNKPITRAEARKQREEDRRLMLEGQALSTARGFGVSEKKAQLIVAVWRNRGFPENMSLSDQLDEAYAIANRKTLVSERNEAMRVARNRGGVTEAAAESHRDSQTTGEPKLPEGEKRALAAAGFVYDAAKRMYKKPLRGGKMFLYRDPKSGKTFTATA